MTSDLNELRDQYHQSGAAFIRGTRRSRSRCGHGATTSRWQTPSAPAKGFDGICGVIQRAAEQISDGEAYTFDTITRVETADLMRWPWNATGSSWRAPRRRSRSAFG